MRVGIVGAGAMARALGGRWVAAGHEVVIGARSTAKAISVADVIGARSGTPADAAAADVVLLAVYHAGVDEMCIRDSPSGHRGPGGQRGHQEEGTHRRVQERGPLSLIHI